MLSQAPLHNLPYMFNRVEIWWLRRLWHMVYIMFMLIKPFSDPLCPVDGGIVILLGHSHSSQNIGQNNGLPSISMHDLKDDGVLIA